MQIESKQSETREKAAALREGQNAELNGMLDQEYWNIHDSQKQNRGYPQNTLENVIFVFVCVFRNMQKIVNKCKKHTSEDPGIF